MAHLFTHAVTSLDPTPWKDSYLEEHPLILLHLMDENRTARAKHHM